MTTATIETNTLQSRRDELIVEHLHLVKNIAGQVQRSLGVHTELDDLAHAGMIGLVDAATKYEDNKEVPFPVYAKHRVRGAILDSLRQLDWASREARKQYRQMDTVSRELATKLQRTPTQTEIAEAMGLDARRWQSLMIDYGTIGQSAVRGRQGTREEEPTREIPCTPESTPDAIFARCEMSQKLKFAMEQLPERHKQVVMMYYQGDKSMKEIGTVLGVNESRVSQIHKSALAKMQTVLSSNGVSTAAGFC